MKKIFFISLLIITALTVHAQISGGWTSNIPTSKRPTTSVVPSVTKLTSPERHAFNVDVPGTLDNANDSTAFAAVAAAVQTKILTYYVVPIWRLDTASGVSYRLLLTDVHRRHDVFEPGDRKNQYKVATDVFRCKGYFEYVAD